VPEERTLDRACDVLAGMNAKGTWKVGVSDSPYRYVMRNWSDSLVEAVIALALIRFDWRPSPAALIELASEQEAALPNEDDGYREVAYLIEKYGLYAKKDNTIDGLYVIGEPSFSHPIIREAILDMGGWQAVCNEDIPSGVLRKQFKDSFTSKLLLWKRKVSEFILNGERPHIYFQPWKRLEIEEQKVLPSSPKLLEGEICDDVKKLLGGVVE